MLDGQLALNTYRVPQAFGAAIEFDMPSPRRGGAGTVPYGPFRCGDGAWIVIGVASNFWKAFCGVVADPRLAGDPRFATLRDRQANHGALDALLEEIFLTRTAGEWQDALAAAGVPVGKVNTIREAFAQPQAVARGMTSHVEAPDGRRVAVASSPIRFVGEQPAPQRAPVARGADNDRLLAEMPLAHPVPAPAGATAQPPPSQSRTAARRHPRAGAVRRQAAPLARRCWPIWAPPSSRSSARRPTSRRSARAWREVPADIAISSG